MEMEVRPVPNTNQVEMVMVEIPVWHRGRFIGYAEFNFNGQGEIKIVLKEEFDKRGISRMLALGEAEGFVLDMKKGGD